jgi:glycyl-tRNA synthetase
MFQTFIGPAQDQASVAYFRPETAQAMFVDFKNVQETSRKNLPFGIAQIGKAFRNEITPGNFIFRTREFEQMELEYFIAPPKTDQEWQDHFERWLGEMTAWLDEIGVSNYVPVEIAEEDRAFYSKRTVDIEFKYPFGQKELYGLAYRTDFDMKNHFAEAPYKDQETGEAFWPHVIEPSWGVDRTLLAVLLDAYTEEPSSAEASEGQGAKGEKRVFLKFKPKLAPYKAAVFPLLRNKPDLVAKARGIYEDLRKEFLVAWDDRGNIGKRYYSQDEIGTPYCITVDFQTLEDGTVTVRDRDTAVQERIAAPELSAYIKKALG